MEDCVLASFTFNGWAKLIELLPSTHLDVIVDQLQARWNLGSSRKITSFRCNVGDMVNVSIENQSDLENVFKLCKISCLKVIYLDMIVESSDSMGRIDCFVDGNAVGVDIYTSSYVDVVVEDVVQVTGQPTTLLSDGWSEIMERGVGAAFAGGADAFRLALIKYAFKCGFRFVYVRNTKDKIIVVCRDAKKSSCDWHIKGSFERVNHTFVVVEANFVHSCFLNVARAACHKSMCPRLMGELLSPNAKRNLKFKASDVIDVMKLGYGVEIPYWKARRVAQHAKEIIFGGYDDSYDNLRSYCEVVKLTNPGSVTLYQSEIDSDTFRRVYISFNASIQGFRHCPPMLFVDGTFLRGRAKGTLLVAVAKDSNNGLFPVAFAVVSAENTDNWCWFLSIVRDTVKHDKKICFLSDRNAGLLATLLLVFDSPIHYYCLYHLIMNLRGKCSAGMIKNNKSLLVKLFKECAYAPNKVVFAEKFENFLLIGGNPVKEWTSLLPFEKWALSYCTNGDRYGDMTSNAVESFNSWALIARTKPITHMFEHIRRGLNKWFVERRAACQRWTGVLVPKNEAMWNQMAQSVPCWNVVLCSAGDYEVFSSPSVLVDLSLRTCSCYRWQYNGFPCCHATAVIMKEYGTLDLNIVDIFLAKNYQKIYSYDINPVPELVILECQLLVQEKTYGPPILGRPAGRPKLQKRILSFGEFPNLKKSKKKNSPRHSII